MGRTGLIIGRNCKKIEEKRRVQGYFVLWQEAVKPSVAIASRII
jgi:hypothetical protein